MGGIAGIIRFDGLDINPIETTRIISLLKHRGNVINHPIENGVLMAFGGNVDVSNQAPVVSVADADVFSSKFADQPFCTNYINDGPASFDEPNADFALALWDASNQTLFCARDILGVRPLYYIHLPNRFFAFASEIKGLTVLQEVCVEPNKHKFREYLTWTTNYLSYSSETFYENIYSVLPGHYLKVTPETTEHTSFWKPDLGRFRHAGGIESYASLFRTAFTEAVNSRMKSKKNIGAHLSGGLDSSSISCISQSLLLQQDRPLLHTFNVDTEQPLAEEQEFVQDVVNQWRTNHIRLTPLPDVIDSVVKINRIFDRPEHFIIPSSFHLDVSIQAERLGCDLLFSGHGGDNVAVSGTNLLNDLADAGDWAELKVASEQYFKDNKQNLSHRHQGKSRPSDRRTYEKRMLALLTRDFKKRYGRESLFTLLARFTKHKKTFGLSSVGITAYIAEKLSNKLTGFTPFDNALTADFKQQTNPRVRESTKGLTNTIFAENQVSVDIILNEVNVICNEQMNHMGAYYGHQYSFPFFDRNVIDVCLATPVSLSFNSGRGRGLIRHGMRHVLPPSIAARHTKANFVEYGTLSALHLYHATKDHLSSPSHPIWEIVDRKVFLKIVSIVSNPRISENLKTRYNWQLSRIVYLSIWLDSFGKPTP